MAITGATGTGATAAATIAVTAITMTSVGSGYTTAPTVAVSDTGTPTTPVGATATVLSNVVIGVTVGTPGHGYTAPTVVFSGGGGSTASATATVVTDVVSSVTMTAPGTGYGAGSGGMKKFVDTLPGLTAAGANNLGQYIPVAVADTTTYPGSDYYEIGVVQYREQLSSSLPPVVNTPSTGIPTTSTGGTLTRGYVQVETPVNAGVSKHFPLTNTLVNGTVVPVTRLVGGVATQVYSVEPPHYLGPVISAKGGTAAQAVPVRVKFTDFLPTGVAGDLFIPVDPSDMGAGMGPLTNLGAACDPTAPAATCASYTQNRATIHLHGGATPWISDGTPYQWITPVGESTPYPKGVSVFNVPDMPDPGAGSQTFFYTNQQSARLMFYHDHSVGITRLNVYAGEAAGYLVSDPAEQAAVTAGTIPAAQIPLVIQDKTFVPNAAQLLAQDPTWDTAKYGGEGSLWFPHVYMPNQNPADNSGADGMGRWDYALWFFPPYNGLLSHGDIANPLCATDPAGISCTTMPIVPGTPNPSLVPEGFMDTPLVNGTAYPVLKVDPKAYRLRILNAANDRSWNLSLYQAAANGNVWDPTGTTLLNPNAGEVPMVPAVPNAAIPFPVDWTVPSDGVPGTRPDILDGRAGGVPDPRSFGPSWVQFGTEGGVLPGVVTIPPSPVGYQYNLRNIVVTNVTKHSLLLGPAERADVVVDFSAFAGKTLILYNDSGAPVPAWDPRNDYYTGDPDFTSMGGAPSTLPGYGPNTRTVMQIQVAAATPVPFDVAPLTAAVPNLFKTTQPAPIVPETAYNSIYGTTSPDTYVRIQDTSINFTPTNPAGPALTNFPLQPKAIQELFELDYGRMNATLGVELPFTNGGNQTTVPLGYAEPTTEVMSPSDVGTPIGSLGDGTQIWKITHNGVDTHAIHVHLFNVQVVNRVGWDGAIRPPDANELGWKETVRMNPLEDAIVALRPVTPQLPFGVPDSVRPIDPSMPTGMSLPTIDPITGNPGTFVNSVVNFGWEYVWHCHLLGHEENDMMRPIEFDAVKTFAAAPVLSGTAGPAPSNLTWTDGTPNGPRSEVPPVRSASASSERPSPPAWWERTRRSAPSRQRDDLLRHDGCPERPYAYRVIAFNAAGTSTSNVVTSNGTIFTLSGILTGSNGTPDGRGPIVPGQPDDEAPSSPRRRPTPAASTRSRRRVGSYKLWIHPNRVGYPTQYYGGTSLATATIITLAANTTLNITVIGPVTLSGTLTGNAGLLMAGAQVFLLNPTTSAIIAASTANASGVYTFTRPPAATSSGSSPTGPATPASTTAAPASRRPRSSPSTANTTLNITVIGPPTTFTLSGTLTGNAGLLMAGAQVFLLNTTTQRPRRHLDRRRAAASTRSPRPPAATSCGSSPTGPATPASTTAAPASRRPRSSPSTANTTLNITVIGPPTTFTLSGTLTGNAGLLMAGRARCSCSTRRQRHRSPPRPPTRAASTRSPRPPAATSCGSSPTGPATPASTTAAPASRRPRSSPSTANTTLNIVVHP